MISLRQPVTQPGMYHQQDEDVDVLELGAVEGQFPLWSANEYEKMEKEGEATA